MDTDTARQPVPADGAAAAPAPQAPQAGPSVKLPGGNTPQRWQNATAEQKQAWARMDRELADELRLERPYVHGSHVGTCPGTGSYGHGLTMRTTHVGSCCDRWDAARTQALADGRGQPTQIDRLMVSDPRAGRLAAAQQELTRARQADTPAWRLAQLERIVRARQAAVGAREIEAG